MKKIPKKIIEHLMSILIVGLILIPVSIYLEPEEYSAQAPELYNELYFIDLKDPFQKALLRDMLHQFQPGLSSEKDSLYQAIIAFHDQEASNFQRENDHTIPFSLSQSSRLVVLYLKFILIYLIVLALTYYGVETFGVYLFIRKQQQNLPFVIDMIQRVLLLSKKSDGMKKLIELKNVFSLLIRGLVKAIIYLGLFTPAYVMAYSIKSDFNTNSEFFLILLAVLSNGILITYTNKFFTLLIAESRKGYVQTARVKNLNNNYMLEKENGLSYKSLFSFRKLFRGHVLNHIFMNARFQYIGTIKEQASFVISGLVIIEMALNIHGQFNYELLQQVLYKNFHYVVLMAWGLFILVKLTDIAAEYIKHKWQQSMP